MSDTIVYRTCSKCGEPKPTGDYMRHKAACRACRTAMQSEYYRRNREVINERLRNDIDRRKKRYHLKELYGFGPEEYGQRLAAQGGVCAICGQENPSGRSLAVDHDHACCPGGKSCGGCVRGLLCNRCNAGIAQFNDNIELMLTAIGYLETYRG